MVLDTQDNTLAIHLWSDQLPSVDPYYRVIYQQFNEQGVLDYIQPKYCNKLYKRQIDDNEAFYVEYFAEDGSDKLCPDMPYIDLDFGVLTMEVISCEDAKDID